MIVKFMGIMDLLSAAIIILLHFNLVHYTMALGSAIYLISKGIAFRSDISSIVDIVIGGYMILLIFFGMSWIMTIIFMIYLTEKGIISLV